MKKNEQFCHETMRRFYHVIEKDKQSAQRFLFNLAIL